VGVPAANSPCPSPHDIASSRLEAVCHVAKSVGGGYAALRHDRGSRRWIKPVDVEAVFNVAGRARRALQQRRATCGGGRRLCCPASRPRIRKVIRPADVVRRKGRRCGRAGLRRRRVPRAESRLVRSDDAGSRRGLHGLAVRVEPTGLAARPAPLASLVYASCLPYLMVYILSLCPHVCCCIMYMMCVMCVRVVCRSPTGSKALGVLYYGEVY
jgi:hypothetical protein